MVTVIVEFPCKEDTVQGFIEALHGALPATRAYEGCLGLDAFKEQEKPNVVLVERWTSKAAYEKYFGWRMETGLMDAIGPMLSGDPVLRYYDYAPC